MVIPFYGQSNLEVTRWFVLESFCRLLASHGLIVDAEVGPAHVPGNLTTSLEKHMGMDTRKTDKMSKAFYYEVARSTLPDTGYVRRTSETGSYTWGVNGSYKSVISEREGYFIPGKFRANPAILQEASCGSVGGMAYSNKDGSYYYLLQGDFWRRVYWSNPSKYILGDYGTWNQNEANLAQVKAEAKLQEAEWNATCSLGELAETLALLKNPFQNVTRLLGYLTMPTKLAKQLKMLNYKVDDKLVIADYAAGCELLYRYGLVPLISDIVAGIKYFETVLEQKIEGLQRCGAGVRVVNKYTDNVTWTLSDFTVSSVVQMEEITESHCAVYYEQKLLSDLWWKLKTLGAHPAQIPANLWEWTWLSFTVDWVVAVGDWLQAITPAPGITLKGRSTSQKITRKIDVDVISISYPKGLRQDLPVVLPYYRWNSRKLERRVPTTAVALPPFNPNFFKLWRLLDTLSLIWSLNSKHLKRIKKYAS